MPASGIETLKVLAGSLAMPSFTVQELAERANVDPKTVNDVLRRRHEGLFYQVGSDQVSAPGRPPIRWAVRPERLSDVDELVSSVSVIGEVYIPPVDDDDDIANASLAVAIDALSEATTPGTDAEDVPMLIDTARNSLVAAGFNSQGEPLADDPISAAYVAKARFVGAASDVLQSRHRHEDLDDEAQVRVLRAFTEAKSEINASQYLALARTVLETWGTVIATPVLVPHRDWVFVRGLFPRLRRIREGALDSVWALDERIRPVVNELYPKVEPLAAIFHGVGTQLLESMTPQVDKIVVGSSKDDAIEAIRTHAYLVLADDEDANRGIARRVARIPMYGLSALRDTSRGRSKGAQ